MHILSFVFTLFYCEIKSSWSLQSYSLFENDSFFNGKSCKNEMAFVLHCLSAIHCSGMCKNNASCVSFFYNDHSMKCTGCMMAFGQNKQNMLGTEQGSVYFYENTKQNTTAYPTAVSITNATSLLPREPWQPNHITSYTILKKMVYKQAQLECNNEQGHLALLDNSIKILSIGKKMDADGVDVAFIGWTIANGKLVNDFQETEEASFTNNLEVDTLVEDSCVLMDTAGKWESVSCFVELHSICEIEITL